MASLGSPISPRDAEASGSLTTGAIAGIACGAGALFLGAAGLFVVYWRRQRQFDREDNSDGESFDERRPRANMVPPVTYTMDYKMDDPQHHEGDHASSYTYSAEKSSYTFSPLSAPDVASAMPTHPAYIPRALVRGSATPSNLSTATTSPPPFPSPPFPSSISNPKTQPDDTVIQAYLAAATAAKPGQPQDSNDNDSNLPGEPDQKAHHHSPTQIPITIMPPFTSPPHSASSTDGTTTTTNTTSNHHQPSGGKRKPRAYLPPPLNLLNNSAANAKPLSGKESTTISGPLAFPQHYHHQYLAATQGNQGSGSGNGSGSGSGSKFKSKPAWSRDDDYVNDDLFGERSDDNGGQSQGESRRTFRSRVRTSWGASGGGGSGGGGEGKDKGKKHARKRSDRNSGGGGGGGNRHYAEIEIGRGSDIW